MKNTKSFLLMMAFAVMTIFALVGCSSQSSNSEKEDKELETSTESRFTISNESNMLLVKR